MCAEDAWKLCVEFEKEGGSPGPEGPWPSFDYSVLVLDSASRRFGARLGVVAACLSSQSRFTNWWMCLEYRKEDTAVVRKTSWLEA